jgi:hypothetical protein
MKLGRLATWKPIVVSVFLASTMQLMSTPARSQATNDSIVRAQSPVQNQFYLARYRECSQRVGPFATQTRAWHKWRVARNSGYAVSDGVVPCHEGWTRGYCFFAFHHC